MHVNILTPIEPKNFEKMQVDFQDTNSTEEERIFRSNEIFTKV